MSLIDTWFDVYAHGQVGAALRAAFALLLLLAAALLVVLGPLAALAVAGLIAQSGGPWLTWAALTDWLTPASIAALLAVFVVVVAAGYLGLAGVTHVAAGAGRGATPRAVDALATALRALPRLLRLALWQVPAVGGGLAALGALVLPGLWAASAGGHAPAWVPAPLGWLLAALLAPGLIWLLLDGLLAVPVCLYERRCGLAGLARSRALLAGHRARGLWLLVLNAGLWTLLAALLIALAWFATPWLLGATPPGPALVLLTVAVLSLWALVALVLAAALVIGYAVLGMHLYLALQERDGLPLRLWQGSAVAIPLAGRWPGLLIALALTGLLAAAGYYGRLATDDLGLSRAVLVAAHRGGAGVAPENTLAALWQARTDGADLATIDVQETADGVVVLLHDADLRRVGGIARNVWEALYEDLRLVDVGRGFGDAFASEPVPTLTEALLVAERRFALDIALRDYGHGQRLPEAVAEALLASRCGTRCTLSAADPQALARVRAVAPDLSLGLILDTTPPDLATLNAALPPSLRGAAAPAVAHLHIDRAAVSRAQVAASRAAGLRTQVGVVNDPRTMARLIDWGVDVIVTDHPARLRRLLGARAAMSDRQRLLLAIGRTIQPQR